jgi:hypothetical protein
MAPWPHGHADWQPKVELRAGDLRGSTVESIEQSFQLTLELHWAMLLPDSSKTTQQTEAKWIKEKQHEAHTQSNWM